MFNRFIFTTMFAATCAVMPLGFAESSNGAGDKTITVSGPWITLADVADASGPLGQIRVAPSPDPGQSMKLDPQFVGNIARENGVYFSNTASAPINIVRFSREETENAQREAAKALLPDANAPPTPEHLLALNNDMSRGDIISASNLIWIEPPKNRLRPTGTPSLKSDVIGKELMRAVRAETAFRIGDVQTPALIKKGDPVTLVYLKGGLRLSVDGKALMDAAHNSPIRVLNNYSKRTIDAVVSGAGEARVLDR